MKQEVLKLNASYFPIGVSNWKSAMVDIISGAAFPVDVSYEAGSDGKIDKNKIEWLNVIRSFDEWKKMPIRDYDEYVSTPNSVYRLPNIVVCSTFNKIIFKKVLFPTKSNIWQRDNYMCGYTGEKLSRETVSIDHIIPKSRGGQNTWENLITASKEINVWKGDRTPKECGLKLLWKPSKPKNGMVFSFMRDEWKMFLDNSSSQFD